AAGGGRRRRYIAIFALGAVTLIVFVTGWQTGPAEVTDSVTWYGPATSASKVVSTSPFVDVGTVPLGPLTCQLMVGNPTVPVITAWTRTTPGATGFDGVCRIARRQPGGPSGSDPVLAPPQ